MNDLSKIYFEDDFKRDIAAYNLYRKSMESVLDFNQVESFADFGCINGGVMESLKRKYAHLKVKGYDVFEWAKQHADPLVQADIEITDLRKKLEFSGQFDVVNCTEVGEHIDREYEQVFLDNLTRATKYWLILSWSDEVNPQHFNPRSASYIRKEVEKRGFVVCPRQTKLLRRALTKNVNEIGYQWWSESVYVYQRKIKKLHPKYYMPGTSHRGEVLLKFYQNGMLSRKGFQEQFICLTNRIKEAVGQRKSFSLARIGDGDFFFLMRMAKGSAAVGRRGTTIPYSQINTPWFRYSLLKNDVLSLELALNIRARYIIYACMHWPFFNYYFLKQTAKLNPDAWRLFANHWKILWQSIFGPKVAFEPVYALVATRWVFREFGNEIGLIGNEKKIDLIKQLMERQEYKNYLGIESFSDYVSVPQKGAADNPEQLLKNIGDQIKNSKAKIFLVGLGHAKSGVVSNLRRYTDAVIIDVGTGIDALAGCINHERPYFADWVNYRLKNYNYDQVDQMDYNNPSWDKTKYKTVLL